MGTFQQGALPFLHYVTYLEGSLQLETAICFSVILKLLVDCVREMHLDINIYARFILTVLKICAESRCVFTT